MVAGSIPARPTLNYLYLRISMKIIKYNKLIRDKIPEIIKKDNAIPKISILSQKRFTEELKKKIFEEVKELKTAKDKDEIINELSDISEILLAIAKTEKINWRKVEQKRKAKLIKRGGFKKKLFLKEVYEQD